MGGGTFDRGAYADYARSTKNKTTDEIYTSRGMHPDLDPKGVDIRESRDSEDNPNSTPVIVGLDVTGSMGILADNLAREGLGTLFNGILERKPITDPHVMFMAIGDANYDRSPLQVSQFEADNRIVEQLTQIHIEKGGGGNDSESYTLPWYFAAFHTEHDSMIKRAKKGYLFTVGDEQCPEILIGSHIEKFVGGGHAIDWSTRDLYAEVSRKYNTFHIVIEEGYYCQRYPEKVRASWANAIGQNVISLSDHTKLAEVIVSAIEVCEGRDATESAEGWGGATSDIVHNSIKSLPKSFEQHLLGHSK